MDPITWALLAIAGAALRPRPPPPAAAVGAPRARLPAPPRHHRRRLHGGERRSRSCSRSLLLPLYTRYLTTADYGAAEVLFAAVVAASIVIRLGLIEALLRFYYKAGETRRRVVATGFAALLLVDDDRRPGRAALRGADRRTARRRPARPGPRPDRDRRPLGADALRVHGHAVPARRARQGLLRVHDRQRPAGDPADRGARRRRSTRGRRACCSAATWPGCRSCSG